MLHLSPGLGSRGLLQMEILHLTRIDPPLKHRKVVKVIVFSRLFSLFLPVFALSGFWTGGLQSPAARAEEEEAAGQDR